MPEQHDAIAAPSDWHLQTRAATRHAIVSLMLRIDTHPSMYAAATDGNPVVGDEKVYYGKQTEGGIECRELAYLRYLTALLECLRFAANLRKCFASAYQTYCQEFDACPA